MEAGRKAADIDRASSTPPHVYIQCHPFSLIPSIPHNPYWVEDESKDYLNEMVFAESDVIFTTVCFCGIEETSTRTWSFGVSSFWVLIFQHPPLQVHEAYLSTSADMMNMKAQWCSILQEGIKVWGLMAIHLIQVGIFQHVNWASPYGTLLEVAW